MYHAENDFENDALHAPVCGEFARPKPPSSQPNLDELFSIPDNISWQTISKCIDTFRPKDPCPADADANDVKSFLICF